MKRRHLFKSLLAIPAGIFIGDRKPDRMTASEVLRRQSERGGLTVAKVKEAQRIIQDAHAQFYYCHPHAHSPLGDFFTKEDNS